MLHISNFLALAEQKEKGEGGKKEEEEWKSTRAPIERGL